MTIEQAQKEVCHKYGTEFVAAPYSLKLGVSSNVREGVLPINGLRHLPAGDTTGWYVWAGEELSNAPDFFKPLHVGHLDSWCPGIMKFLGLPPGWRFLVAPNCEDVWFDRSLLEK
jgi:hypothetical protein